MAKALTDLNLRKLSNLEAGQVVKRNLTDIGTVPSAEITDVVLKNYLTGLAKKEVDYEKTYKHRNIGYYWYFMRML